MGTSHKSLVSVIVPIFNTEQYLDRCLISIIGQTYSNLEVILVDDGSTDRSAKICEEYEKKDYRIIVLHQVNQGASFARNTGLDAAHGDYILFVDSDDWIENDMVENLINDIQDHEVDMVISQVPLDKKISKNMLIDKMEALPILLNGTWWGPVGKLFKKNSINDVRFPKATISEDYVFMMHTILNSNRIYYEPNCFYHREIRKGSLSRIYISERKLEEFDNVAYVAHFINENFPQFRKPAEARLAETSLKLLFSIYNNKKESVFYKQKSTMIHSVRNNILGYLNNSTVPLKSKLLLMLCTTAPGCKIAQKMHSWRN